MQTKNCKKWHFPQKNVRILEELKNKQKNIRLLKYDSTRVENTGWRAWVVFSQKSWEVHDVKNYIKVLYFWDYSFFCKLSMGSCFTPPPLVQLELKNFKDVTIKHKWQLKNVCHFHFHFMSNISGLFQVWKKLETNLKETTSTK